MRSTFLSRKFIIALVSIISCTVLVLNKSIADGVYSAVMVATVGAYLAANVIQKKDEK
jgi:hypothetical protein